MQAIKRTYRVILILIFGLLLASCSNASNSENTQKAKQTAIELMNKSYDQDFAVKSIKYSSSTQSYELEMYPKDQPSYVFPVVLDAPTQSIKFNTYDSSYQKKEAFSQQYILKPFLDSGFNDYVFRSTIVANPLQGGLKELQALSAKIDQESTLLDALNKYHKEMFVGYTLKINTELSPEHILKILESAFIVQQFLQPYQLPISSMDIYVYTLPRGITMAEFDKNATSFYDDPKYKEIMGKKETYDDIGFSMKGSLLYKVDRVYGVVHDNIKSPLDMAQFMILGDDRVYDKSLGRSRLKRLTEIEPLWSKVKALYAQQHGH